MIEIEQPLIPKLLPEYEREAAELNAMIEGYRRSGHALRRYHAMNPGMRATLAHDNSLIFQADVENGAIIETAPPALPSPAASESAPPAARHLAGHVEEFGRAYMTGFLHWHFQCGCNTRMRFLAASASPSAELTCPRCAKHYVVASNGCVYAV